MTHHLRFVAVVAVLTALALCVPVQAQTPEEIDAMRVRAEAGDAEAQNDLGVRHANGDGVPQDDAEGVRWYRLAADQGYVAAQYNLGIMYETGESIPQDYVQAYMWYDLSASRLCCEMLQHAIENRYRVGSLMNSTRLKALIRRPK